MAKTRASRPSSLSGGVLQAAAFPLEVVGNNSLLYTTTVVDYMVNTANASGAELAWSYFFRIPEARYVARYLANALSIATLYVGDTTNSRGAAPVRLPKRHPANDLMADFSGGQAGQSELLDRLGMHLTVIGDSVLIGPKTSGGNEPVPFDQWRVFSSSEVHSRNGRIYVQIPGNSREVQKPDSTLAIRVWRPSPRLWWDSDSPIKGSFTVLRELDLLDQHVQASAVSRLAGAGMLLLPEELDLPNSDVETEGTEVDQFVALLTEVMGLAIKNRDSAAALVPIILRGPAEFLDKVKHLDFYTEFSQQISDLRMGAIRRLALGMDVPPEILLGSGSSASWCLDDKTQIYTKRGWLSEPDTQIGDEVLSLNNETGMSEWQPILDIYRSDVVDEPMVSIEGSWHSSLTTMGHRWPVLKEHGRDKHWERESVTSAEILGYGQRRTPKSQTPIKLQRAARLNDLPTEPKYHDALVELVAWMFTEGHLEYRSEDSTRPKAVQIYQSHRVNSDNCIRIRSALTALYGPARETVKETDPRKPVGGLRKSERTTEPSWREVQGRDGKTVFTLNQAAAAPIIEHCPRRNVTSQFIDSLTYAQLRLFIEVSALGDGTIYKTGHLVVGQKDPRMLDAVERAAILAGLGIIRYVAYQNGFGGGPHLQHYVSITPNRLGYSPRSKNISVGSYTGRIWCPTVSSTHSMLIMRDGKTCYTGNSAYQIDDSTLRLHIVPMLQLIASSLTVGWLRPSLENLPLTDAQKEQIPNLVVHFDISNLKIHQDVSGDAQALFDRFEIDSEALRLATGFSGNAEPDPSELARQILLKMVGTGDPTLVGYAVNALRDKFNITQLPEMKAPEAAGPAPGRPTEPPAPETTPISSPVPGERSQAKELGPPPTPKPGDNSNNEVK